jgi:hypothetical protein
MNHYRFVYLPTRYLTQIVVAAWFVLVIAALVIVGSTGILYGTSKGNGAPLIFIVCTVMMLVPLFAGIVYGHRIFSKKMTLHISGGCLELNGGQNIIDFESIVDIKMRPMHGGRRGDELRGYWLDILYAKNRHLRMFVFDDQNFLEFHSALCARFHEYRQHCQALPV